MYVEGYAFNGNIQGKTPLTMKMDYTITWNMNLGFENIITNITHNIWYQCYLGN